MEISSVWYKEPHLFETFLLDKDLSLFSKTKSLVLLRATTLKCMAISVRPNFGIGIRYWPKVSVSVSVSEPKSFFPKPKLFFFFFKIFHVFLLPREI